MFDREREIAEWRGRLAAAGQLPDERLEELEAHLRDAMDDLARTGGLSGEEAFFVAARRMGNVDQVAKEVAKAEDEESWRGLSLAPGTAGARERRIDLALTACLALAAGLLARLAVALSSGGGRGGGDLALERNLVLLCLPSMAWVFAFTRKRGARAALAITGACAALAAFMNLLPWTAGSQTETLAAIHLPVAMWLACLPLYAGARWREAKAGMDFLRYSGEVFVYTVLLALGVGALMAFVGLVFGMAGFEVGPLVGQWIFPIGMLAAPVVAARLALARRNVAETVAPVLARIFAPLFLLALAGFAAAATAGGRDPFADRNALIAFDLALALVLALVLWSSAMRDPRAAPGASEWVELALAVVALGLDAWLLAAMAGRLGAWGVTPNRVAALGENLVLLADLAGLAFLMARRLLGRRPYEAVLRWQTAFLAVIFAWTAFVALGLPLLFGGA